MRMPDWNMKDSFSVGVNTDKFHIRLVGERLLVESPSVRQGCEAVHLPA